MATNYLRRPGSIGKATVSIATVLTKLTFGDYVKMAEQAERERLANECLAQIEAKNAKNKAQAELKAQHELQTLERPEYTDLKHAKHKDALYRRHIAACNQRKAANEMSKSIYDILLDLVRKANESGRHEILVTGGLQVLLRKDGGVFVLTIWRNDKPPAAREWNTIVSFWPYDLGPDALIWSDEGVSASGKYYKQRRIKAEAA